MTQIFDFQDPRLDLYARYSENDLHRIYEPDRGLFLVESPRVILRALAAGYEPVSCLMDIADLTPDRCSPERLAESEELIGRLGEGTQIYTAEKEVLRQMPGYQLTRGAFCLMRRPYYPSVEQVCKDAKRIAVLEKVGNPTNIGAIFRSAAALGMDAVLLTPGCSDPLYRRAARVSMGTVFQIPWTWIGRRPADWPEKGMPLLHSLGFRTVAMALRENTLGIEDKRLAEEEKLAVILGTEGDGLADETIADADYTVCIPMARGVDSLNVAAASAVAFWNLRCRENGL